MVLLGPTASGKTAPEPGALPNVLDLPVINVDSRQLYREMDMGTAKPTAAQQARVPHHLLDLRDPDQPITLQEFQQLIATLASNRVLCSTRHGLAGGRQRACI